MSPRMRNGDRDEVTPARSRRTLSDRYLAEDVVQETMPRAWRHRDELRSAKGSGAQDHGPPVVERESGRGEAVRWPGQGDPPDPQPCGQRRQVVKLTGHHIGAAGMPAQRALGHKE